MNLSVCVCVLSFSRVGGQGQGLLSGVLEPVGLLHCSGWSSQRGATSIDAEGIACLR